MAINNDKFINFNTTIPSNKIVKITNSNGNRLITVPLILDDEFSFKISSSYHNLSSFQGNNFLNLLSGATNGFIPSGQFTLQSAQIWEKTEPLDLSFNAKIYMNNDAKNDVIIPVNNLISWTIPSRGGSNIGNEKGHSIRRASLIPPGPNLQSIISLIDKETSNEPLEDEDIKTKGVICIRIGKLNFPNVVIKSVNPTFSDIIDDNGYPTSADVSIDATTVIIPTVDYMNEVFNI